VTPVDPKEIGFQFFCFSILHPCFVIVCCFLHFRFLFSLSFLGVVNIDSDAKAATSGFDTHDKRNRCKRAAKDDRTPPKMKKNKVSQDINDTYEKFVQHGHKLKKQPKNYIA
jgi:hypothetical protein